VKDLISDTKMVSTTTQPVVNIVIETTTTTQLAKTLNEQEKLAKQQELEQVKLKVKEIGSRMNNIKTELGKS